MSQFFIQGQGGSNNSVLQLTPDDHNPVLPTAGNINVFGLNGIVTSNGGMSTLNISGGVGIFQTTSITLTAQQVKNLGTTPITILAAPGIGKIIVTFYLEAKLIYGGTSPFTAGGTADLSYYNGVSLFTIVGGILSDTIVTSTQTSYSLTNIATMSPGSTIAAQVENLPVTIGNLASPDWGGNAANDNQLKIYLQYMVLTT